MDFAAASEIYTSMSLLPESPPPAPLMLSLPLFSEPSPAGSAVGAEAMVSDPSETLDGDIASLLPPLGGNVQESACRYLEGQIQNLATQKLAWGHVLLQRRADWSDAHRGRYAQLMGLLVCQSQNPFPILGPELASPPQLLAQAERIDAWYQETFRIPLDRLDRARAAQAGPAHQPAGAPVPLTPPRRQWLVSLFPPGDAALQGYLNRLDGLSGDIEGLQRQYRELRREQDLWSRIIALLAAAPRALPLFHPWQPAERRRVGHLGPIEAVCAYAQEILREYQLGAAPRPLQLELPPGVPWYFLAPAEPIKQRNPYLDALESEDPLGWS